jgi:hypothetical protein
MLLFQFGFTVPFYLFRLRKELFTALYYLQKLLKPTINLIIGWVFSFFFVASILHLGCLFCWYDNQPYRDILFYTFSAPLWIGPISFFYTQSLLNPSFKFSKKRLHLTPDCYIYYTLLLYLIYDNSFLVITISIKTEWKRLWAMVSKTRSTLHDCVFYFKYPILQCIQKLMFQVVSYADSCFV